MLLLRSSKNLPMTLGEDLLYSAKDNTLPVVWALQAQTCIPWSTEMMAGHPNRYNYLLFWFFYSTLSICIYHQKRKAKSTVSLYSCQHPFAVPRATSNTTSCQLCSGPFYQGICHIAICSLSFAGILSLKGSLHGPKRPPPASTQGYLLVDSNHLPKPGRRFL